MCKKSCFQFATSHAESWENKMSKSAKDLTRPERVRSNYNLMLEWPSQSPVH